MATTVTVGGAPATGVVVVSPTQLTAVVPAGSAPGPVDVTVVGTSGSDTLTGGFTYLPPPVIDQVLPSSGATDRTAVITVFGSNIYSTDAANLIVYFDDTPGTLRPSNGGVTSTAINVAPPPGVAGTSVDVHVWDMVTGGSNTLVDAYTYLAAGDVPAVPTMGVVDPSSVPAAADTLVTVAGTGFVAGNTTLWLRVVTDALVPFVRGAPVEAEPGSQVLHVEADVASATQLSFTVPAGVFLPATSASLSVYTPGGAAGRGNAVSFT